MRSEWSAEPGTVWGRAAFAGVGRSDVGPAWQVSRFGVAVGRWMGGMRFGVLGGEVHWAWGC